MPEWVKLLLFSVFLAIGLLYVYLRVKNDAEMAKIDSHIRRLERELDRILEDKKRRVALHNAARKQAKKLRRLRKA